ncbi:complement component 1 Q subcomponent-binding protein, mitochondrial [Agrilus planipennis]|uniref:Complement component 1 Q subcomponent-binding protein, mitochondrial n=1 Tax=Agrilus planipennis TaxID=224129 RepID=A0A1W4XF16_AGRPL|nr:complement component 1 Q subcomponent-binding protein, mitochondrial [Agrilus planipennis]
MSNILKIMSRSNLRCLTNIFKSSATLNHGNKQHTAVRNLWYLSNNANVKLNNIVEKNKYQQRPARCAHTKGERDLVEFLTEEILTERKAQKAKTIPTELDGFKAQLNGAEVTLTKVTGNETIKIQFNVNHTVDTGSEPEIHPNMDKPDIGELKSKPSFKVDLVRDNTTVSLVCSFVEQGQQDETYNDIFQIDEISIYDGEWNEHVYAVSGEIVDSYLYDLLLNYLEEKGISNDFVEKLSDYSTAYEHSAYIGLLEGLSRFVSGK